jgi:hypothetical protein
MDLIRDPEIKQQMEAIDKEASEKEAKKEGPFIVFIKKSDGTIENYGAQTLWRLVFNLIILLQKKYYGQFEKGIVFKIVRGTAGSDSK